MLICSKCAHHNDEDMKFCGECGLQLLVFCAECSASNPSGNKFCGHCGALLRTGKVPSGLVVVPPRYLTDRVLKSRQALEDERKQVTVLFADVKGSMELLAERDPEDARKLLDPVLEQMMDAVHHFEGTVNQVLGDGIMALFGAPISHEDHAVRACYAALRMQDSVRRYSRELRAGQGIEVQIRIGLNSGEVVVRSIGTDLRMDYSAIGQTTHLAARMEQLATPGTTRLTASTALLAEGYITVEALGPVPVKGLANSIDVFELRGAGAARTRLQVAQIRGLVRFVGRDIEMSELLRAAQQARAGKGQVLAVVGEPGVGKSRLYHEFVHSDHVRDFLVLEASSVSYGRATSFLPLADLLRRYFRIDARDDVSSIRVKVAGVLMTLDESLKDAIPVAQWLLDALPDDHAFLVLDPGERRRKTFAAVKRILMREVEQRPLLLVFEDLHWIDAETQAFLDGFIESVPAARVLVAVNYRPEYRQGWGNRTYYRQLRLDPLTPKSADDLLDALLGVDASVKSIKGLLIARTEGRPLFLEECVRMMAESGTLAGEPGRYRLARAPDMSQIPGSVQAILAGRIDRLELMDKRLLQAAAVIGVQVPFALLQAVTNFDADSLRASLARLQTAEFLYESRLFPELEYAFKHALTHEIAYASMLHDRRKVLHGAVVEAIERVYADRIPEHIERLAYHAVAAKAFATAVRYLLDAGKKAISRSANLEATAFLEQALTQLGQVPQDSRSEPQELSILLTLGPALIATKGPHSTEVEQLYLRALALVDRLGADTSRFPVLWNLWYVDFTRARHESALCAAERLVAVATADEEEVHLLEAHHAMWPTLTAMGRPLQALVHIRQGMSLYDPERHATQRFIYGGHDPGACSQIHAAMVSWLVGVPDRALREMKAALRLADELAHPPTSALSYYRAGWLHYQRGEFDAATFCFEQADETARLTGNLRYIDYTMVPLRCLRETKLETGALPDMLNILAAIHWPTWQRDFCVGMLTERYLRQNDFQCAHDLLRWQRERSVETCMTAELWRLDGEGQLLRETPDISAAERCFQHSMKVASHQESLSWQLRTAISTANLMQKNGRFAEARTALETTYVRFAEGFGTADLQSATSLLERLSNA